MRRLYIIAILALGFQSLSAQSNVSANCYKEGEGSVQDKDGNTYKTVKIGNQWWMAQNLRVTQYSDGTPITGFLSYTNDPMIDRVYGKYYDWSAALRGANSSTSNVQGVCPNGWHIPSDDEWKTLEGYIGMEKAERDDTGMRGRTNEALRLVDANFSRINNGNCTGLSIVHSGWVLIKKPEFEQLGLMGFYFTSTEFNEKLFWTRMFHDQPSDVHKIGRVPKQKAEFAISCRCVKD